MEAYSAYTFSDYLRIAKRRWWIVVVPAITLAVVAYGVSLLMPNTYTSETVVLVERQRVPDAFVRSVIAEDLGQRLGTMQEQILSRTRLQDLIERFDLYKKSRGKVPMEDLVAQLKKQITVTPIRGDYSPRTGGLPGFSISVVAESPKLAQTLCSEVASLFMEENLRLRGALAQGTTDFLKSQLDNAKKELDEQDAKLAEFKSRYMGQLPGSEQTNLNMVASLTTQLDTANQALSRAQQDKIYIESMLADHAAARTGAGATSGGTTAPSALQQQLNVLNQQLAALEGRYTSDHPEVIKLRQQISEVRRQLESAPPVTATTAPAVSTVETPEVRQLRAQLRQIEETIRDRKRQQDHLQAQLGTFQERLRLSPAVEENYKKLTRDYQTALNFYNDLLTKHSQSEMATNLERQQEGEQFRVMDPPNLPERPTSPKRAAFAGGGFGFGLMLGLGCVLLLEIGDRTLKTDKQVEYHLQVPVLLVLPELDFSAAGHRNLGSGRQTFAGRTL